MTFVIQQQRSSLSKIQYIQETPNTFIYTYMRSRAISSYIKPETLPLHQLFGRRPAAWSRISGYRGVFGLNSGFPELQWQITSYWRTSPWQRADQRTCYSGGCAQGKIMRITPLHVLPDCDPATTLAFARVKGAAHQKHFLPPSVCGRDQLIWSRPASVHWETPHGSLQPQLPTHQGREW